jgi:uncharacterized damage-inducible protein DinB
MIHSHRWRVPRWREDRLQIRATSPRVDFFAPRVSQSSAKVAKSLKRYQMGSPLSWIVPLGYKRGDLSSWESMRLYREEMEMLAEAQALWQQFEHVNNEIFKWADGLSDDQLNWKPSGQDTNSIGILMNHILGIEIFQVAERVGGQSVNRDRASEFANRATRAGLVQRRAEVEKLVRETFDKLTAADLSRTIRTPNGEVPVPNFLLGAVSHVSDHMGQVILTRKLLNAQP